MPLRIALLVVTAWGACACDRPPARHDLRPWTAADHDRNEETTRAAPSAQPTGRQDALVEVTWNQQCATCHGREGRGDGPTGPMVKAPDLTRADWQSNVKDEDIAAIIRSGKGRMPKFDLPPATLAGLVARIRASRGR